MLRRTPTCVVCRLVFRILSEPSAQRRLSRHRYADSRAGLMTILLLTLSLVTLASGCYIINPRPTSTHDRVLERYDRIVNRINYADAESDEATRLAAARAPRALLPPRSEDLRPMSLREAIHLALNNSDFIRIDADFLSPRGTLLNDAERASSIFDVAIQDSSVVFGQRGPAAALADFEPRFQASMLWQRDENVQNNAFLSGGLLPGDTLYQESAAFNSRIEKVFATGGSLALDMTWNYSLNNAPARLFGSAYTGTTSVEYRHPLWGASGTEFTQIAGPSARLNQSGVFQGILIARINRDISVTEFQNNVQKLIYDVEQVYWDLHFAYREYYTQAEIARGLKKIWDDVKAKEGLKGGSTADEGQAADNHFQAQSDAEQALAALYNADTRLRRLLGLPPDDGKLLHPIDVPTQTKPNLDWTQTLLTAFSRRLELQRQKLTIRSLQYQVKAARNLAKPRLDFVSAYRVNGFGDRLNSSRDDDGVTAEGLRSAFGTMLQGNQTGWDLGFQMTIPLGFRFEQAQVRNLEWRLAKARSALATQEREISHELRAALTALERWHANLLTNQKRMEAAKRRVNAVESKHRAGLMPLDLLLRAEVSRGQARVAYYRAVAEFNKAIANLRLRAGTTLDGNGIRLQEGTPTDLRQAQRRHGLPPTRTAKAASKSPAAPQRRRQVRRSPGGGPFPTVASRYNRN